MTSMSLKTYEYSNSNYYSVYKISGPSLFIPYIGSNSSLMTITNLSSSTLQPSTLISMTSDSLSLGSPSILFKFSVSHYASGSSPYVISSTAETFTNGNQTNLTNFPVVPGTVYPNSSALSFVYLL